MSNQAAVAILKAAREIISVPERWTKKALARDSNGTSVDYNHPEACCWCLVGAMLKFYHEIDHTFQSITLAHRLLALASMQSPTPQINDYHTHEEVLAIVDKAIRLGEEDKAIA